MIRAIHEEGRHVAFVDEGGATPLDHFFHPLVGSEDDLSDLAYLGVQGMVLPYKKGFDIRINP
jgi:hypothetical protein